jgi:PAS domain S-box-containing protein
LTHWKSGRKRTRSSFDLVTKSKEEWVATFDAIQDLISIHDRDYNILKINKALAKKFNKEPEDLIGKKCHEVFHCKNEPDLDCPHSKTLRTSEVASADVDDMGFDGVYKITTFPVFNEAGTVWASVHVARDITQERFLREQLLHAEKLSSLGKLVAGIAHELNNPLWASAGFQPDTHGLARRQKLDDVKDKLRKIYHESLSDRQDSPESPYIRQGQEGRARLQQHKRDTEAHDRASGSTPQGQQHPGRVKAPG